MEKLLRLLNPKTVNFEPMPTGGIPSLTTADVCLAMSYARLSPMQSNLIRLKCLGANSIENIEKFAAVLLVKYDTQFMNAGLAKIYHLAVIRVALIEFCMVPASYKPSCRNRAIFAGVSHQTVKNLLSKIIDELLDDFQIEFNVAAIKVSSMITKET